MPPVDLGGHIDTWGDWDTIGIAYFSFGSSVARSVDYVEQSLLLLTGGLCGFLWSAQTLLLARP